MIRRIFNLTVLLLLQSANCALQSVYEEFNNKQITLTNTSWKCNDLSSPTQVLTCTKGMDLVVLKEIQQPCHKILNIIETTVPHFKIQLYIDVYGYNTIDANDYFLVGISENSFQESLCIHPFNQGKYLQQCSSNNNIWLTRKSYFQEIAHSNQQLSLEIRSEVDGPFNDESYLFRNVQIILDRCYKTCKTCSGEGKEQCLSCYDDIILSSNNSCDSCQSKTGQNFLQIPDGCRNKCTNNQDYDEDYVCIEDINLQVKCEIDCELCTNTQSCLICKPQKYLYFGQCMDQCPKYTIVYGTNCLSNIDSLLKNKNLRITQLVREFHDLSTTKSLTNELFQIISTTNQYSLQKGNDIYYSYFSNKRIFGGPLVWVNAEFKFTKSWIQEFQFIRIFFEVILGDIELNKNILTYKLNDQQQETIILNEMYQGNNPNIQDQIWPDNYQFNIYKVEKSINFFIQSNKQLTIEIKCQNANELGFCGIQNMVIIGFSNCEPEYNFDFHNYETGRNPCIPICGDKIVVGDEECDDGNNDPFDGCFNCRYECEDQCSECLYGYCIIEKTKPLLYSQKIQNDTVEYKLKCQESEDWYCGSICNGQIQNQNQFLSQNYFCNCNCLHCVKGICYLCQEGNYLFNNDCIVEKIDQIMYVEQKSFCGDGIIQVFEQCDDTNYLLFDGCFACKHSCDINCYQCFFGRCEICKYGYVLTSDSNCFLNCGDDLILPYQNEQCDNQNTIGYDGCYCKLECQPYCLYCDKVQQCLKCKKGFSLQNNYCIPICGDGFIVNGFEECDDANYQPFDGCYECKYQCHQNCGICNKGNCQHEICQLGMQWTINSCSAICGDNLVVEIEECDDGNSQEFDGCFNCKYSCIENCEICKEGSCRGCKQGFFLKDNKCLDLTIQQYQYQDYQLTIQNSKNFWICHDQECAYSQSPKMKIVLLNQFFQEQYIQVYFDQEVKLKETTENLSFELFDIQLKNYNVSTYRIKLYPIQEIAYDAQQISYQIEIKNLINFDEKPLLQIDLINEVTNTNNQTVSQRQVEIKLKTSIFLSDEKRLISLQTRTSNKVLMIVGISFSVLSLISGETSFFVQILNVLQYQSYLKFINIDYPENLVIYFSASEILEISTYLQIMEIDQIYNIITPKEESPEVDGKFKFYNVDPDLFINILPQIIQMITLLQLIKWDGLQPYYSQERNIMNC